jgi:hypothetical protein
MDNVLAKNENANTAQWKHALRAAAVRHKTTVEGPVHSDYETCIE